MFLPVLLGIILLSSSFIYAKRHIKKLFFISTFCFSLARCEIITPSLQLFLLGLNVLSTVAR